jgi:hypothetical protein
MKMYNLKKYKQKIKYINIILFIIMIFNLLPITSTYAVIRTNLPVSSISDTFPNSYKPYIDSLKAKYPNWIFKAVYTNLDWAQSVNHETYISGAAGISTIHDSYGSEWKKDGVNNYIDGPYVQASVRAVEYVLDPRNSLTEDRVFQFENLNYSQNVHTSRSCTKSIVKYSYGK